MPDISKCAVATVAAVVAIGIAIASLVPSNRQCTIKISNFSSRKLVNPKLYISSGHCYRMPPLEIPSKRETIVEFRKTALTATGAVGVFTYNLCSPQSDCSTKVAYMFSVPYDFNLYSNWHAVGLFGADMSTNKYLYEYMYYENNVRFTREKAGKYITYVDGGFKFFSTMANTYTPEMTLEIHDL